MAPVSLAAYRFVNDRIGFALAAGGLGLVTLVALAVYGAALHAVVAVALAAAFAFALSTALVSRSTRHWRRLLTRAEAETKRRIASSEQASLFSSRVFLDRLSQECGRSTRYGLDLTVLYLRCDAVAVAHYGASDDAAVKIVTTTATCLRSEDVVGRLGELEYGFFLPHTQRPGAEVVLERIRGLGPLVETVGLGVFREDGLERQDRLQAARADAERRQRQAEVARGWNQRTLVS